MRRILPATCLAFIGLLCATPGSAQTGARVSGRVLDRTSGGPIAAAQLRLRNLLTQGGPIQITTAGDGSFSQDVTPGRYEVHASRIGYQTSTDTLQLESGQALTLTVELEVSPVAIDTLQAGAAASRPYLGGFWERREKNLGFYFTRADIEKKKPYRITDLFRSIPGVRLMRLAHGPGQLIAFGRVRQINGNLCPAAVYLDGRPFATGQLGVDDFPLADIEAIEAYSGASRVPTQFNITGTPAGDPRCGVIALWTRGQR